MRNMSWNISVLILSVFLLNSFAHAQGVNGYFDINKNITKQYEDGERTLSTETFNRNLYLNLQEPITPVLSYQFNLRTNFIDSETTDSLDATTTRYNRSIEPALDLILGNPVYNFSSGIRRREQWNAAHMNNENRKTNEYYYSRLSLSPDALPSLTLQMDKQKNYDYLTPKGQDDSSSVYFVNSAYDLPSGDVRFRYTVSYSYNVNNTPLSLTNKNISDNFNGTYNIGHSRRFWQSKADYSIGYQGNYSRNKSEQFVTQTGMVLNKRMPFAGLYILDDPLIAPNPKLNTENELINNIFSPVTPGINIRTGTNHNIGIWVSPENSIDRLYIYVDKDVRADVNLINKSNWIVYKSNSNTDDATWTVIPLNQVTVVPVDDLNNIYRYELIFTTEQTASYFKAVNRETVSFFPSTDVLVTEIEALGTDIADEERLINASNSFTQQLSLITNFRPTGDLTLALNYTVDRSDQNMISIVNSVGGVFGNIFSDSVSDEKWNFISNITRGYGASAVWLTHRFLTSTLRVQRNESFDNINESDLSTNSYNLTFFTEPLPTLNANLSLIRSDSSSFNEKASSNDSLLLSVGSRLYRDVNMITDVIYTRSRSFATDTSSSARQINGTLDALLTRKLSGTINYHFSWTESSGIASRSSDGSVYLTYRPGKLININVNFKMADSEDETSTAEGILIDWLPLQAIRFNLNYQHSDSEPGPVTSDSITGYVIWYVTKFADARINSSYIQQVDDKETENYSMSASLNCRF